MLRLTAAVFIAALAQGAPLMAQDSGSGNWSGFYGGLQFGTADVDGRASLSSLTGDDSIYGLHAGYASDLGAWVLGVEMDHDAANVNLSAGAAPGAELDSVTRLKLRAGYDLGRSLLYATAGAARADTSVGDDTGDFYGVGVSYEISDRFVVSGEYLNHEFSGLGDISGQDAEADTLTVRFSLRF